MSDLPQYIIPFALIAFILYRRIKRSIGFQLYKPKRLLIRSAIFCIVSFMILAASLLHPSDYLYDFFGVMAGSIILIYAFKHSSLEIRVEKLYYRTHIWIESLILFIFLSRFLYRFTYVILVGNSQGSQDPIQFSQAFTRDPWSRAVFFLLATYYVGFNLYIWKKGKRKLVNGTGKDANVLI
ncbi:hypothetical protein [Falsibacillus albus]|uniref:DUF1453 family protein n=1 Tax=Falsibacillus albus TaxID=2478915 RepID=A0A3L7K1J3_9BACI|nr:hypothetical protein [Falsibacillus albus]RLQ96224.1 hypothetical protein D9X91_08015 [Falsibacillus albus]